MTEDPEQNEQQLPSLEPPVDEPQQDQTGDPPSGQGALHVSPFVRAETEDFLGADSSPFGRAETEALLESEDPQRDNMDDDDDA